MSDLTTHLLLPYILAAQAQKHVTHNEALRLLDAMIQLSVLDRDLTAPPVSLADGDRHIVASGATGLWAGWDLNVAFRVDGAWMRLVPRPGWLAWIADEQAFVVWNGSVWETVGMPQDLKARVLGLGGATADSYNRLSVNTPAVLLNNDGAGIEATVNKATPANDAALAFKTGFSARALFGLLGSDDFSVKVSPDGSSFIEAIKIDRSSGHVELPQPTILPGLSAAPSPPPAGKAAVYARSRAGAPWIDVMRPSGRDFPLQPHFGVNRIANWSPSTGITINTEGLPITSVGTVSTPGLAATNLATSMRRWRLTSAATVDAAADQRSAGWACWRGNGAGLGGWTFATRFSLTALQATGMGFFGLYGSTAAVATTLTLAAVVNCIGIGFQRGTHANWQVVRNDGTGAPPLTDMGASFAIATGGVLTVFIAAPPNGSSVWVRVVDEVSGAVFEQEITVDLPASTQFLSPRLYLNTGATAGAVAYDCSGLYVETDY
ncbi:DUF2793 domain-containing protein [Paracoccus sp. MC1862]|uniref:DUF2793 domain-containing protein n=1 Tax=Paracoccus sp. MC1862 TaxID=2760307 RepID=UPI0015FEF6C5|nr:DUF2793 domain-containing protein [Paracoccus sp. MC1862]MBB1499488.1 DUF2793 domain-containing protein [Paracoccus sp. MC1862]QQO43978.1 DUF2793 domain-containing protein [Paracoccus sp. MC1862]